MRRRKVLGVGIGMLATAVGAPTRAQHTDAERVVAATRAVPGLATGLSQSGDIVLFGFDDGNVVVYDDDRDGTVIPIDVDRSVSHIAVSDAATAAVVGWMDANVFARLDLATVDGTFVEHVGLWDLATTPDAGRTASVSSPAATPGSVRVADSDGRVLWDTPFGDATGQSVAIADGGNRIAVGAGHYWADGTEPTGQPGVRLYDNTGTELWRHDHAGDVLAVGVDADRDLVVAGTDDGNTIVLDVAGQVVWETAAVGGWLVLSDDGGTVVTADRDGTLYAIAAATGEVRWTADIGMGPTADLSVSADGSRVFAADRGAGAFVVVDDGEPIWTASHDVGPGRGAIAADGGTWSTIVTDLAAESARLAVYRTPDAVAEPESTPPRDAPPADEDSAVEDDESSDDTDDSAGDDDEGGGDDGDDNDDDDDEGPSDPVSLALADYHILGEQASEEYITLRNTGDGPLELSGWTIRDRRDGGRVGNSASPFEFPTGFTLAPGAAVTISTGAGKPTAEMLYWGYSGDFQIWNEEGDVVIVRDASGTVVFEQEIAADQAPDPPGDDVSDEPAGNDSDEPIDPPEDDVPDEPTDSSGDEPDDPTEPPTGESTDPPSDDPDEPTDPPDEGPDQPADPPADEPAAEPIDTPSEPADGPVNPPSDDTADSPATSGGADGAEPNHTDAV